MLYKFRLMIKEMYSLLTFAMTLINSRSSFKWQARVNSYKWHESFKKKIILPQTKNAYSLNDMLVLIFSHYLCYTMFFALHGVIKNKWNDYGFTFIWHRECFSISHSVCESVMQLADGVWSSSYDMMDNCYRTSVYRKRWSTSWEREREKDGTVIN